MLEKLGNMLIGDRYNKLDETRAGTSPKSNKQSQTHQLMVNCWFEARWFGILRVPLSINPFHRGISAIQTTGPQTNNQTSAEHKTHKIENTTAENRLDIKDSYRCNMKNLLQIHHL